MLAQLSQGKSLLVRSEILRQFVNTLTANDKYSCRNREILQQQIQTQLSQKPKPYYQFFIAFLKSPSNSE